MCSMQPVGCLLDPHIREALKKNLREQDRAAAIIDELPLLRGRGRADLAFVNGELCGYEIKSEADSLVRFGMQADNYESVFEFNTLVSVNKHLDRAGMKIPDTWGIIEAKQIDGQTELYSLRNPQRNCKLNNSALVRLLWKNECLFVLRKIGFEARGHEPVAKLWTMIEAIDTQRLCDEVREALKRRHAKAAAQQTLYDGLRTTVAIE
jgi:hypothetical protein